MCKQNLCRRISLYLCVAAAVLSCTAIAENVEYELRDGRVEGVLHLKGFSIPIRMADPAPIPETICQYKTAPTVLNRSAVINALSSLGYDPRQDYQGEKWYFEINDETNDNLLLYYPHWQGLGYSAACHTGLAMPLDPDKARHVQADLTFRAFLDALGMDYEYPFYACMDAFQHGEFPPPETLEEYLSYHPRHEQYRQQGNYTLIVARKTVADIPYVMSETRGDIVSFGTEVKNPYAAALIDDAGKLVYLRFESRWPQVSKAMVEQRPLISWQEALGRLPGTAFWDSLILSYRLVEIQKAELSYSLTTRGIAIPVWNITVKGWYNPSEKTNWEIPKPEKHNYNMMNFVIDAVTGEGR